MKLFILASTLFASSFAQAAVTCPMGSTTELFCKKAGHEYVVVDGMVDQIAICNDGNKLTLIMNSPQKPNEVDTAEVQKTVRAGATSYSAQEGNVTFTLSRIMVMSEKNGKFTLLVGGQSPYVSMSCK